MVSNLKPLLFYGSKGLFSTSREDGIIIQISSVLRLSAWVHVTMVTCSKGYCPTPAQ